jgi:uncharacterized membrane protein YgcG
MTPWPNTRDLLSSPTQFATAWVQPCSIAVAEVKEDRIECGHGFGRLAVEGDSIWVTNAASESVTRIDGRTGQVDSFSELRRAPAAIAVGTEAIWVVCGNGWLWRFHPDGQGEGVARLGGRARDLACDRESAWILHGSGELVSVDQATGETAAETKIRRGGRQILCAEGALVALTAHGSRVCRIAPTSGAVEAEARLPARGVRGAVHDGTFWVACGRRRSRWWGALVPVDLATMEVGAPHPLPSAPRAIAVGAEHVWVACGRRGEKKSSVIRIDPDSGDATSWVESDWTIYDLAVSGDRLLLAAGLALAGPAAAGGDGGGGGGGHHGGGHGGGGGGEGGGGGH